MFLRSASGSRSRQRPVGAGRRRRPGAAGRRSPGHPERRRRGPARRRARPPRADEGAGRRVRHLRHRPGVHDRRRRPRRPAGPRRPGRRRRRHGCWTPHPGPSTPGCRRTATHVAYVVGRDLRVVEVGGEDRPVVRVGRHADVSWGSAEFVAAEEMGRTRGHWWSPDGRHLAVARVDVGPVELWHLADLAEPGSPPTSIRYPAAGTANALVGLWVFGLDGTATPIEWDAEAVSLPGQRGLVGRRRPARRRAEPGPAHDGRPAGGPGHRGDDAPPAPAGGRCGSTSCPGRRPGPPGGSSPPRAPTGRDG